MRRKSKERVDETEETGEDKGDHREEKTKKKKDLQTTKLPPPLTLTFDTCTCFFAAFQGSDKRAYK